jgi:hypothetical protein
MEGGHREYFLEGLMYYLKSILFVRPMRRFITRFVRRVLMRKLHEFRPWNVFMVFNRDVGTILVLGRYCQVLLKAFRVSGRDAHHRCCTGLFRRSLATHNVIRAGGEEVILT